MTPIYQFGPFRLDPAERLLLRDEHTVPLTPKAFDLLVYLVEHQGRLVERRRCNRRHSDKGRSPDRSRTPTCRGARACSELEEVLARVLREEAY
jgi:DNA-binding response OmpR family regulator